MLKNRIKKLEQRLLPEPQRRVKVDWNGKMTAKEKSEFKEKYPAGLLITVTYVD